jgi:hypothetical protein
LGIVLPLLAANFNTSPEYRNRFPYSSNSRGISTRLASVRARMDLEAKTRLKK